jgi:hypothetical protein
VAGRKLHKMMKMTSAHDHWSLAAGESGLLDGNQAQSLSFSYSTIELGHQWSF